MIGHGDAASWNILARDGLPHALIDWERAGPIDPWVELAQACWLNAKLFDERVARIEGLPAAEERARHVGAILDGYGLARADRVGFVDHMIAFAIHATAAEADEATIDARTRPHDLAPEVPWALAWRARSAAWMSRHRAVLARAIE